MLVILIIIIVLLVVAGVAVGMNWNRWFGDETTAFSPDLDPDAEDWTGEDLSGSSDGEAEGNPCYFTFTLMLKDTNEVLYTSGMVAPGQVVNTITMSRALEAGEYDAVIQIETASLEDGSAMNGATVICGCG